MSEDNGKAELVKFETRAQHALEPSNVQEAMEIATALFKSGLLPRGITKPEAAFAVIMTGRELGLTAMQSLRAIHVIEGKPSLSADLMVACVKRSPQCKSFRLVKSDDSVAAYNTERVGEGQTTMTFTIEQARAAGVTGKDNWRKYPAAMLRARCAAALARAVYPDLLMGFYDPDELTSQDAEPVRVEATIAESAAPPETPETEDETIVRLTKKIHACTSVKECKEVAQVIRAEVKALSAEGQLVLSNTFKAHQKSFEAKTTDDIKKIAKEFGATLSTPGEPRVETE